MAQSGTQPCTLACQGLLHHWSRTAPASMPGSMCQQEPALSLFTQQPFHYLAWWWFRVPALPRFANSTLMQAVQLVWGICSHATLCRYHRITVAAASFMMQKSACEWQRCNLCRASRSYNRSILFQHPLIHLMDSNVLNCWSHTGGSGGRYGLLLLRQVDGAC